LLGKRTQGLFETVLNFELHLPIVNGKKNKVAIFMLKLGRKFVVILAWYESGRYSGQSLCPLYLPANLYLLLRLYYTGTLHNNGKIRREIQNPQMFETDPDLTLFPQQYTLSSCNGRTVDGKKEKGCVTIVLNVPSTFVTPQISTIAILSNRRFSSSSKSIGIKLTR
jgi:hypothetical protein